MITASIGIMVASSFGVEPWIIFTFGLVLIFLGYLWIKNRSQSKQTEKTQICTILGSGGHTTQMCQLMRKFQINRTQKVFVISGTSDTLSESFFLKYMEQCGQDISKFKMLKSKRTNQVKQSKVTSILSTLMATLDAWRTIVKQLLGVTHLIANGPGICVPYFFVFFCLNKMKITRVKLIFVESWCRVNSLSAAGRIISFFADQYIVHWEEQLSLSKKAKYYGRII